MSLTTFVYNWKYNLKLIGIPWYAFFLFPPSQTIAILRVESIIVQASYVSKFLPAE